MIYFTYSELCEASLWPITLTVFPNTPRKQFETNIYKDVSQIWSGSAIATTVSLVVCQRYSSINGSENFVSWGCYTWYVRCFIKLTTLLLIKVKNWFVQFLYKQRWSFSEFMQIRIFSNDFYSFLIQSFFIKVFYTRRKSDVFK